MPLNDSPTSEVEVQFTQEVRFAVVMYGGISLAIYMNGVAQEMLKMVRATAPRADDRNKPYLSDQECSGTERVYRKIGQLLNRDEPNGLVSEVRDRIKNGKDVPLSKYPISTRFVIDVVTGTSAGGLNGVYLAKAIANQQSLYELKKLWINEADAKVLLNDRHSFPEDGPLKQPKGAPLALFNSQIIYDKLRSALRAMNKPSDPKSAQGVFADELDLFVTATDLRGRLVWLKLNDKVVAELRHRHVFHFRYRAPSQGDQKCNDFEEANNDFLAFVARCTSAHPAAFEPMQLADVEPVLAAHGKDPNSTPIKDDSLRRFYREYFYQQPDAKPDEDEKAAKQKLADEFAKRSFNDGGVLDNRPFSYAIDQIPLRYADVPVNRKLLYLEPGPDHPELNDKEQPRPDFVRNALLSLSTLPSDEPIAEDLARILARNRLIERVNRILLGFNRDSYRRQLKSSEPAPHSDEQFEKSLEDLQAEGNLTDEQRRKKIEEATKKHRQHLDKKTLDELVIKHGPVWSGYHRLRVAETTSELALLVARATSLNEESDEFLTLRNLVRYWREQHYDAYSTDNGKQSELLFLMQFDLQWMIRRVKFLLTRIDQLSQPDYVSQFALDQEAHKSLSKMARVKDEKIIFDEPEGHPDRKQLKREFRQALSRLRGKLSQVLKELRIAQAVMWAVPDDAATQQEKVAVPTAEQEAQQNKEDWQALIREVKVKITASMLKKIGELSTKTSNANDGKETEPGVSLSETSAAVPQWSPYEKELKRLFDDHRALLVGLANSMGDQIQAVTVKAENDCYSIIIPTPDLDPLDRAARRLLLSYYRQFPETDQITYPILYSTDAGEELDPVEVFRISPEDATALFDEGEKGRSKLAGTTLGRFGGFFEQKFRENDIRWGRLDGAERLITALLPDQAHQEVRDKLIREAHCAILEEELGAKQEEVEELLRKSDFNEGDKKRVLGLLERLNQSDPITHFQDDFDKNLNKLRQFTLTDSLHSGARAARIFGRMLDGYAAAKGVADNPVLKWSVRLLRWVSGLVEVAIPDKLWNKSFLYWVQLLYLFEVLLIVFGMLVYKPLWRWGVLTLAATGMFHSLVLLLGDWMREKPWWWLLLVPIALAVLVIIILALPDTVLGWLTSGIEWLKENNLSAPTASGGKQ